MIKIKFIDLETDRIIAEQKSDNIKDFEPLIDDMKIKYKKGN